jgi:hypothetical protein
MNVDQTATRRHLAENLAAGIQCNINNERSALRMLLRLFFVIATQKSRRNSRDSIAGVDAETALLTR